MKHVTKKTGRMAVKARQLARSAKIAKYKQMLAEAGEELSLPKPSREAQKQKDEELRNLYLELVMKRKQPEGQGGRQEQAEQSP